MALAWAEGRQREGGHEVRGFWIAVAHLCTRGPQEAEG